MEVEVGSFSCPIFSKVEFSENRVLTARSTIVLALTTDRQRRNEFCDLNIIKEEKEGW